MAEPVFAYAIGWDAHEAMLRNDEAPIAAKGISDIYKLRVQNPREYSRVHVVPGYFEQPLRYDLGPADVMLNLITDPDVNPRVLTVLAKILEGFEGRVINPPEAVIQTSRDQVAARLAGLPGLKVPKVLRLDGGNKGAARKAIEAAAPKFPLILRRTGTHTGNIVGVMDDADALIAGLGAGSHFATEFVDFRSPDGCYRKYRFFFIGEDIIFRHMLAGPTWSVHMADRFQFQVERPELLAEEKTLFEGGLDALPAPARKALKEIRKRIGLDFFGLDAGILADGRMLLFETNATMNFFPFGDDPRLDYVKACLAPAQRAFHELLFGEKPIGWRDSARSGPQTQARKRRTTSA